MISTRSPAATGSEERASQRAPSTKIFPVGAKAVRAGDDLPDEDRRRRCGREPLHGERPERQRREDRGGRDGAATSVASSPRGAPARRETGEAPPRTIAAAPPTARTPCDASFTSRKKNRAPSTMRKTPGAVHGQDGHREEREDEADRAEDARQDPARVGQLRVEADEPHEKEDARERRARDDAEDPLPPRHLPRDGREAGRPQDDVGLARRASPSARRAAREARARRARRPRSACASRLRSPNRTSPP